MFGNSSDAGLEGLERYSKPVCQKLECARPTSGTLHLAQALSNRGWRGRRNDFRDAERLVKRLRSLSMVLFERRFGALVGVPRRFHFVSRYGRNKRRRHILTSSSFNRGNRPRSSRGHRPPSRRFFLRQAHRTRVNDGNRNILKVRRIASWQRGMVSEGAMPAIMVSRRSPSRPFFC